MAITAAPPPLYGMCTASMPACCFSISIARWLVVPLPFEAALSFPLWRFARATSSPTLFAGTLGCTTRMSGTDETRLTGARSFSGLKPSFASVVLTESAADMKRIV